MPVWDNIAVGQQKLALTAFDETQSWYEDFTGKVATDVIDMSATRESQLKALKAGFYAQGVNVYWGEGPNLVPAQINQETQHYLSGFTPNPSNFQAYEVRSSNLVIHSRATTAAEKLQYRVKGYYTIPGGQQAQEGWFTSANGFPSGPPADWAPVNEGWDSGGVGNSGGVVRFDALPADHLSGMVSNIGRREQSFGRTEARGTSPSGGSGTSDDIRQIEAHFAAMVWKLRAIIFGTDINDEPFPSGTNTHMPGNPNGDGILEEADAHENFSNSIYVAAQTLHWHDGTQKLQDDQPTNLGFDVRTTMTTYGVDITPGKIGFYIGDTYTHVINTPSFIANPLPIYQKDAAEDYKVALDGNGLGIVLGTQKHADNSDRYMKWFMLSNFASQGKFVRDYVRNALKGANASNVGEFPGKSEMEIEYFYEAPLAVDNPDQHPVNAYNTDVITGGGVPEVATTAPIPVRQNTFLDTQPEGVLGHSFTVPADLAPNADGTPADPSKFTYLWTVGAGLVIQGPSDQYHCTMAMTINTAAGTRTERTFNCDINPI
ncbi:hypothetical protein [uncultured Paraglaciecola sp.]|uniref:hypothetical protein n=1 Tax=uncultured Paraglaciecola sp. TaxID=1765024 RepID=UPI0026304A32|nr:hypothetical protein [uncultured Paraglaciecola sp.]